MNDTKFTKKIQVPFKMSFLHTGGIFAEIGDEDCTHLVVDDQQTPVLPKDIVLPHFIVRAEVLSCIIFVKI